MTLSSTISNAYDLSSVLCVCSRSLQCDTPLDAGDEQAAADTIKIAKRMADGLIDALEKLATTEEAAEDGIAAEGAAKLLAQWKAAKASRDAFVRSLHSDEMDEPAELGALDETIERLAERISRHQPLTDEDAAAMLEWCVEDCAGELLCEQYPRAQRAVISYLRKKT